MKTYYSAGFGLYLFGCVSIFWEVEQSVLDIGIMLVHHATTLFLIALSYMYSFHRIGSVILLLHDIADPLMELAKLNLYAGRNSVSNTLI